MQENKYQIMRYRQNGTPKKETGYPLMTIDQARQLCSREDTHKNTGKNQWFLGFTLAN